MSSKRAVYGSKKKSFVDSFLEVTNGVRSGDEVYFIDYIPCAEEDCSYCNKTGVVTAIIHGNEEEIICPKCSGMRKIRVNKGAYRYVPIRVTFSIGSDNKLYFRKGSCYLNNSNCIEFKDTSFYKTKEEAQEKVNELNKVRR